MANFTTLRDFGTIRSFYIHIRRPDNSLKRLGKITAKHEGAAKLRARTRFKIKETDLSQLVATPARRAYDRG